MTTEYNDPSVNARIVEAQLEEAQRRAAAAQAKLEELQKLDEELTEKRKALILAAQADGDSAKAMAELKKQALQAKLELEDAQMLADARIEEERAAAAAAKALQDRKNAEGILAQLDEQTVIARDIDQAITDIVGKIVKLHSLRRELDTSMAIHFPGGSASPGTSVEGVCREIRDLFDSIKNDPRHVGCSAATTAAALSRRIIGEHGNYPKGLI